MRKDNLGWLLQSEIIIKDKCLIGLGREFKRFIMAQ